MSASDRSTTKTVVIATLALVVTFAAGVVIGVVADRWMLHRGRPHQPPRFVSHALLHRLDRHLDLNEQQEAEIRRILERRHERMRTAMGAEIAQVNAEIERTLTPEQRVKFQELRLKLGRHMHRGGKGRKEPTR